jgi:hypothetical protein
VLVRNSNESIGWQLSMLALDTARMVDVVAALS